MRLPPHHIKWIVQKQAPVIYALDDRLDSLSQDTQWIPERRHQRVEHKHGERCRLTSGRGPEEKRKTKSTKRKAAPRKYTFSPICLTAWISRRLNTIVFGEGFAYFSRISL